MVLLITPVRADSFRGGEGAVGAWIDLISFEKRAQSGLDEIMNGFRDVMSIEKHLKRCDRPNLEPFLRRLERKDWTWTGL